MAANRYQVVIDDDAIADLAEIRRHIESRGAPDTAVEFTDRLLDEIYKLETFPAGHQRRRPSRKVPVPLWQLPFRAYRVVYTIIEAQRVARVLGAQHGGRSGWP